MGRLRLVLHAVAAAALLEGAVGAAQTQRAAADQAPPVPLRTINLDAIVTDSRGAIVTTLTTADFELRENGQPVSIDDARLVTVGNPVAGVPTPVHSVDEPRRVDSPLDERAEAEGLVELADLLTLLRLRLAESTPTAG